ncbi:hypothetical protein DPMN_075679 [Dreissena polymorpha]|uniref:Secreted protein n=1 Tax=Dreissena polymorpha TaxID=45954 RepID=A0A9D3YHA3_DREPO|nr:hypothetical protein DPMN_075679 [Dreissena polymorpha]
MVVVVVVVVVVVEAAATAAGATAAVSSIDQGKCTLIDRKRTDQQTDQPTSSNTKYFLFLEGRQNKDLTSTDIFFRVLTRKARTLLAEEVGSEQSLSQSVSQSVSQSLTHSVSQSVSHSVSQSISQSVRERAGGPVRR